MIGKLTLENNLVLMLFCFTFFSYEFPWVKSAYFLSPPAPPTAATHESRSQRARTVLGRYARAGPDSGPRGQLQKAVPVPRGHCAPHSRAGRSSPAPRRRPQEPTINRVRKRSFKKPWKVSFTVSNKVWVLILSSPLLPELKGPEERVVALAHP